MIPFWRGSLRTITVFSLIVWAVCDLWAGKISIGTGDKFRGLELSGLQATADRDGTMALRLADNRYRQTANTDLLLHFDSLPGNSRSWRQNNYLIDSSETPLDRSAPRSGSGCARYVLPSHRTLLKAQRGSLLAETADLGSFTFEFFIYPYSIASAEVVFSHYGTWMNRSGKAVSGGIRCLFHRGRIRWEFVRFFRDADRKMYRTVIQTPQSVALREWSHIAVSFNHFTGKLVLRVDGEEQAVQWTTDTGSYGGSPLIPAFHPRLKQAAVIGGSFRGKLDEFRISSTARTGFRINRYFDKPGSAVSPVYDLKNGLAALKRVSWSAETPSGSAVLMEYRLAPRPFRRNDKTHKWIRVANGQSSFSNSQGRYLQWRVKLIGVERGRVTPLLREVNWEYSLPETPIKPLGLKAVAGDGRITLSWLPNMDQISGYMIYIGTEKGEYLLPRTPVTVRLEQLDKDKPRFVLYGLENDRLYYISIRAFVGGDKRRLSQFSAEVFARPSFLLK